MGGELAKVLGKNATLLKPNYRRMVIMTVAYSMLAPHPSAKGALAFIYKFFILQFAMWLEAFSSCAIETNRLAEVCTRTLKRLMKNGPVFDRYLVGLAQQARWMDGHV